MFTRGAKHLELFQKRAKESPLWSHCEAHHDSQPVEFVMELAGTHRKPLERQVTEGIYIHNFHGLSMNRKQEWLQPAKTRTIYERSVEDE